MLLNRSPPSDNKMNQAIEKEEDDDDETVYLNPLISPSVSSTSTSNSMDVKSTTSKDDVNLVWTPTASDYFIQDDQGRDDDRIRVGVRIRPLIDSEKEMSKKLAWESFGEHNLQSKRFKWEDLSQEEISRAYDFRSMKFTFDKVFSEQDGNLVVYHQHIKGLVEKVMEGYNATVLAYGQTTSGKTHTITGGGDEKGILQLALEDLFRFMNDDCFGSTHSFIIKVGYCEIYKEMIKDLLDAKKQNLSIVEDPRWGPTVLGLSEHPVYSVTDALKLLELGQRRRKVGKTAMTTSSSRSHSIFQIRVQSKPILRELSLDGEEDGKENKLPNNHHHHPPRREEQNEFLERDAQFALQAWAHDQAKPLAVSTLNIIDLAGSERVSKTRANGKRLKEAGYINKSLSALGDVIVAINEKHAYVPYRNSKLTRLLSAALGGNSHTAMICCISPSLLNHEESRSTLNFAQRASHIQTHAKINQVDTGDAILKSFKLHVSKLQKQLAMNMSEKESLRLKISQLEEKLSKSIATSFKTPKFNRKKNRNKNSGDSTPRFSEMNVTTSPSNTNSTTPIASSRRSISSREKNNKLLLLSNENSRNQFRLATPPHVATPLRSNTPSSLLLSNSGKKSYERRIMEKEKQILDAKKKFESVQEKLHVLMELKKDMDMIRVVQNKRIVAQMVDREWIQPSYSLKIQLENEKKRNVELEQQLHDVKDEMMIFKTTKFKKLLDENKSIELLVRDLEKQIMLQKEHYEATIEKHRHEVSKLTEENVKLNDLVKVERENGIEIEKTKIKSLESQVENLQNQIKELKQNTIKPIETDLESYRKKLERSNEETQRLKIIIEELEAQKHESNVETQQLKIIIEELEVQKNESHTETQRLKLRIEELEAQKNESNTETQRLKSIIETQKKKLEVESKTAIEKLEAQKIKLEEESNGFKTIIEELEKQKMDLKVVYTKRVDELEEKLDLERKKLQEKSVKVETLKSELSDTVLQLEETKDTIEGLFKRERDALRKVNQFKVEVSNLETKLLMHENLEESKRDCERFQEKLQNDFKRLNSEEVRIKELKDEMFQDLKNQIQKKDQVIDELKISLENTKTQLRERERYWKEKMSKTEKQVFENAKIQLNDKDELLEEYALQLKTLEQDNLDLKDSLNKAETRIVNQRENFEKQQDCWKQELESRLMDENNQKVESFNREFELNTKASASKLIESLKEQNKSLRIELENVKAQLDTKVEKKTELENQTIFNLRKQLEIARKDESNIIKDLKSDIDSISKELKDKTTQVLVLEEVVENMKKRHKRKFQIIGKFVSCRIKVYEKLAKQNFHLERFHSLCLKAELCDLKQKNMSFQSMKSRVDQLNQHVIELRNQFRSEKKFLVEENQMYKESIKKSFYQMDVLKSSLKELEEMESFHEKEWLDLWEIIRTVDMPHQMGGNNKDASLKVRLQSLVDRVIELETKLNSKDEINENLTKQVETVTRNYEELKEFMDNKNTPQHSFDSDKTTTTTTTTPPTWSARNYQTPNNSNNGSSRKRHYEFLKLTTPPLSAEKMLEEMRATTSKEIEQLKEGNYKLQKAFQEKEQQLETVLELFEETEHDFQRLLSLVENSNEKRDLYASELVRIRSKMVSILSRQRQRKIEKKLKKVVKKSII